MTMSTPRRLCALVTGAAILCLWSESALGQGTTHGPNGPAAAASVDGPFFKPWITPSNALTSNNVRTASTVTAPLQPTDFLDTTSFGFSLGVDRVITGIDVAVEGRSTGLFNFIHVQLLKGGVPAGQPMSAFFPVTPGDTVLTFSDENSPIEGIMPLWGTTWSPAQINAGNFGVRVTAESISTVPVTFEVDHVRVTVHSFPTLPMSPWAVGLLGVFLAICGMVTARRWTGAVS